MRGLAAFRRSLANDRGATGAEFAMVLPLALIFLLGIIDAGRYLYTINQGQKAVQVGARYAAVTDIMPASLINYSFVVSGGITQGDKVTTADFTAYECTGSGSAVACTCETGGTCNFSMTTDATDNTNFNAMFDRMQLMMPSLTEDEVRVRYENSLLGYAGDPNGPDIAPFITVSVENATFTPISLVLFGVSVPLPMLSHTLTMEDGRGTNSY
ncbi:MAG: pilus assembly protein [Caenibius sp.]